MENFINLAIIFAAISIPAGLVAGVAMFYLRELDRAIFGTRR